MTVTPAAALLLLFAPAEGNSLAGMLFMYAAIGAIFYFLLIRPQQRQRRAHDELIRALKKGDEIVTAGGIVGQVIHIRGAAPDAPGRPEDLVTIKSGDSRLVVERGRITRVIVPGTPGSAT